MELALTGDCRSELNDLSEDLTLPGLHESLELLITNFGLVSDLFLKESALIGVDGFDLSYDVFFVIDRESSSTVSEPTEWRTRVLESELMDEQADLSIVKSRESVLTGVLGLTVRLEGFESGPIVSPELNDFVLSGDFGLFLKLEYDFVRITGCLSLKVSLFKVLSGLVVSGFVATLYISCDSFVNLSSIVTGEIGRWPTTYLLE